MKTDRMPLSNQQQVELNACAEFLGWTVLGAYTERCETDRIYFFIEDDKRALVGTPYAHEDVLIAHGASKYGIKWTAFDPYANPADWYLIVERFKALGWKVQMYDMTGNAYVMALKLTVYPDPQCREWDRRTQPLVVLSKPSMAAALMELALLHEYRDIPKAGEL